MTGESALQAEVAHAAHEALPKKHLPEPVHLHAGDQRLVFLHQPAGEAKPVAGVIGGELGQKGRDVTFHFIAGGLEIAPHQDKGVFGLCHLHADHLERMIRFVGEIGHSLAGGGELLLWFSPGRDGGGVDVAEIIFAEQRRLFRRAPGCFHYDGGQHGRRPRWGGCTGARGDFLFRQGAVMHPGFADGAGELEVAPGRQRPGTEDHAPFTGFEREAVSLPVGFAVEPAVPVAADGAVFIIDDGDVDELLVRSGLRLSAEVLRAVK